MVSPVVRNESVLDFQLPFLNADAPTLKSQAFIPCQVALLEVFPRVDERDITDEEGVMIRE